MGVHRRGRRAGGGPAPARRGAPLLAAVAGAPAEHDDADHQAHDDQGADDPADRPRDARVVVRAARPGGVLPGLLLAVLPPAHRQGLRGPHRVRGERGGRRLHQHLVLVLELVDARRREGDAARLLDDDHLDAVVAAGPVQLVREGRGAERLAPDDHDVGRDPLGPQPLHGLLEAPGLRGRHLRLGVDRDAGRDQVVRDRPDAERRLGERGRRRAQQDGHEPDEEQTKQGHARPRDADRPSTYRAPRVPPDAPRRG